MVYLLDVNVLLALCDPRHMQHEPAHLWFGELGHLGWATCPITENGFIRIASLPSYPNSPGRACETTRILREFCTHPNHHFWPDDARLIDASRFTLHAAVTSNQTTDIYLLGLAATHGGRLATFDRSIPFSAVAGGEQALEILPAGD